MNVFMQVLHNAPGYTDTIVSAGATAYFVQQYQASLRNIIDDAGRFVHLHHKSTFATAQVIAGTHTGKNFIGQRNLC